MEGREGECPLDLNPGGATAQLLVNTSSYRKLRLVGTNDGTP